MKLVQISIIALFISVSTACKSESQIAKAHSIQSSIQDMRQTMQTSTDIKLIQDENQVEIADRIVGIYEVRTDYYMAVYEIEKYKGKYIGKVHYYNDGETEYEGKGQKEDYFLSEVSYLNGRYTGGKMYLPNGSYYEVVFTPRGEDFEANMTVQGKPYTELWKRKVN